MDPDTLRKVVEDAVYRADRLMIVIDVFFVVAAGIVAGLGSYFGAYLQTKGKNLATKEDFQNLLDQSEATTRVTEGIRRQIQSRSEFRDKVMTERYTLIKEINKKLEAVRVGYGRMKRGVPTIMEIVNGETLLLTEVDAELQLNRWVLTEDFYNLLKARYDIVNTLWQHTDHDARWEEKTRDLARLNEEIQKKMWEEFGFRDAGAKEIPEPAAPAEAAARVDATP